MCITHTKLQKLLRIVKTATFKPILQNCGHRTERRNDSVEATITNSNSHPLPEKLKQPLKVQGQKPSPDSTNT